MNDINTSDSTPRLRKIERTDSEAEATRLNIDVEGITSPDDDDDFSDYGELPAPPDGGYGWVIVIASFMCNMTVDGIAYTFGIFIGEFVDYFGEGKGKVAWVGSLLTGVYLGVGPIVSALANKFGCRTVCIAGSIIGCAAFALSTLSQSVDMLMITYGVLGGFGFGMIYLPAVVAVGYYFETKRSLATGIAVCGSGFGTFAFAPLATWLLGKYGWKKSLLIFAGLILSCAIFGAMMRPLTYPKKKKVKPLMQRMYEEKQLQLERGSIAGSHFMVQLPDGTIERKLKMPLNADPGVHSSLNLELLAQQSGGTIPTVPTLPTITEARVIDSPPSDGRNQLDVKRGGKRNETSPYNSSDAMIRNASQPTFSGDHQSLPKNGSVPTFSRSRKTSTSEKFQPSLAAIRSSSRTGIDRSSGDGTIARQDSGVMVRPLSRKDIFYSRSVVNLQQFQSEKSLATFRNSMMSLSKYDKSIQSVRDPLAEAERDRGNYDLCPCFTIPNSIKSVFGTMMDVTLLKNPVFMAIGISNIFGMAALYVPFVYLVDAAKKNGIDSNSASFLISIIGITNTFGRVICGWVADFPQVDSLFLNNMCLLIATVSVALTPLCVSYGAYVTMSIFFGIAVSGYISLTSIILVDLLGLDKLTNAFGLLILFRGFAAIIGSPMAGAIYDITQSYDLPFYIAGALFAVSTITSFLAPWMKRFVSSEESPAHIEALTPINEEQGEDDDEEDQPITIVPKIVKTLPSPQHEEPASRIGSQDAERNRTESKL